MGQLAVVKTRTTPDSCSMRLRNDFPPRRLAPASLRYNHRMQTPWSSVPSRRAHIRDGGLDSKYSVRANPESGRASIAWSDEPNESRLLAFVEHGSVGATAK